MPRPTERASEVEAGLAVLDASRRDGVDVALAEQDVVPAVQLDLAAATHSEDGELRIERIGAVVAAAVVVVVAVGLLRRRR